MTYIRFFVALLLLFVNTVAFCQSAPQLFREGKELREAGKSRKAIAKFEEALEAAESEKNIQIQMNAHLELAELKDNVINYKEALNHYKEFSALYKKQTAQKTKKLEESVSGLKTEVETSHSEIEEKKSEIEEKNSAIRKKESAIDSLTTEHLQSQLSIKDLELTNRNKELELKTSQNRWNILLFVLAMLILAAVFIVRGYALKRRGFRILKKMHQQIVKEKQKSEDLLLNILPESIAGELKESGKTTPCRFDIATVMFTDFQGFTRYSENHSPEELVKLVDHYFRAFDQIVKKHNIEKIKTIGDSYMCVAGIPDSNENHATNMIRAAFEFREFVNNEAFQKQNLNQTFLRMRIGIHSGPLVAGVVGSRKFSYDVWGDTVNIAARMEQSGEPDGINVSESVYELVKNEFEFIYRGEVEAKNKGRMKMYFVTGEKIKRDLPSGASAT